MLVFVSFPINDPDLWQHLAVGRAIWQTHFLSHTNVWTWPSYGAPYVIPSWLFRVVLWPFWSAGGIAGVFVWRWLTTLAAFALLAATARVRRAAGATGVAALFALLWCGEIYRFRSQARPETLVAILMAAELWLLERRRNLRSSRVEAPGGLDPVWWLVPLCVLWVNVHLSYPLALFIGFAYLLDDLAHARRAGTGTARTLALALGVSAAACFVNPYGLGLVRPPFDFAFVERNQAIFRNVAELGPLPWAPYLSTGLPLLLGLSAVLALWRWRKSGPDFAELLILATFITLGLRTQRFIGYAALGLAPFLARDLSEFCATRRWPQSLARPGGRLALGATALAVLLAPNLAAPELRPAIALRESAFPIGACDAIASRDVRGHAFNLYSHGGYLLWRFLPERERLPFMDVHQTGDVSFRDAYFSALFDSTAWRSLDARWRFDWVLLGRSAQTRSRLLEVVDRDTTTWSLIFLDDVAALYVRRGGVNSSVAEHWRYRWLPGGYERYADLAPVVERDSVARLELLAELKRSSGESRFSAGTLMQLGNLARVLGRYGEARDAYARALAINPGLPAVRDTLAALQGR